MGNQARLKRSRRELNAEHTRTMAALRAEVNARPEVRAYHASLLADEGLQARWRADLPGQKQRLTGAGWKWVRGGTDGAGQWIHRGRQLSLIHSVTREDDGNLWGHLSVSGRGNTLPTWPELRDACRLLYPDLIGVQVVVPADKHVNLSEVAHTWTCLTASVIPDFGRFGVI
jgi:hypothetical protein